MSKLRLVAIRRPAQAHLEAARPRSARCELRAWAHEPRCGRRWHEGSSSTVSVRDSVAVTGDRASAPRPKGVVASSRPSGSKRTVQAKGTAWPRRQGGQNAAHSEMSAGSEGCGHRAQVRGGHAQGERQKPNSTPQLWKAAT